MRLKSLFLASAAALVFAASAHAADAVDVLPSETAPAPSGNYVSVCDTFGAGYFFIPGTETCLKIGGQVEATGGYSVVKTDADDEDGKWASIEARMDVDTRTESELGTIGTKFRVSLNHTGLDSLADDADDTELGVELAYITAGPAFIGYKETLVNTDIAYGDTLDIENYAGGSLNALTAGVLVENLGGGFYVGGAVESAQRSQWIASYDGNDDVDFVGRAGIAGQSWGGSDVSAGYSKANDGWMVKSTTDLNVLDNTQARLTAAYFDFDGEDAVLLGGGAKHSFTEQISAFAGAGYLVNSELDDPWVANAGVVYTPIEDFNVKGEFGYGEGADSKAYNTTVKFTKSF